MAKNELDLGSTFKEFLETLNTNTEDTKGIIQGTKKVKKLSLGEEDAEKGSLEYNIEDNVIDVLLKGQSVTLQCNPHEQGWGSKIVCDRGLLKLFADDDIEIRADKGAFTRFYNDITFNEANIVGEIDFSNATVIGLPSGEEVDTSNLVTLDTEQTITGKKSFKDFHIIAEDSGIVWSENLITNQTDLSGLTITFDTNRGFEEYDEQGWNWTEGTLLESSGGYKLSMGGPPNLFLFDKYGNETLLYDYYSNTWLVDTIILPADFGYITGFATEYPDTLEAKESAIATLNIIAPSTSVAKLNLGNIVLVQPEEGGIIATQKWVNSGGSDIVTLNAEQTLSNKTINRELKFLDSGNEVAGSITYGGTGGLSCNASHFEADNFLARESVTTITPHASMACRYCIDGIVTLNAVLRFPTCTEGVLVTQEQVQEMINASIMEALNDEY